MPLKPDARAEVARRALPLLDLTNLGDECTADDVRELWHQASTPFGPVAAVCIWPRFVPLARDQRRNDPEDARASQIAIAAVANFPSGDGDPASILAEVRATVAAGADEIDLVMPWPSFLAGDEHPARGMIESVASAIRGEARLKVIFETGALPDGSAIARASALAIESGADFIKTSTGKTAVSATPDAARTMIEAIAAAGRPVGFKASGGIRTVDEAAIYLALADEIMGRGWASPSTFRFGASSLLADLLTALDRGA